MDDIRSSGAARAGQDIYRLIPYLAFLAEMLIIGVVNHGSITYTLDDAYIHLALAERIGQGTYGINVGEFAAPASSILWPLILAPFSRFGFFAIVPCVLNLAAALGTLTIMAQVAYRALETDSRGSSHTFDTGHQPGGLGIHRHGALHPATARRHRYRRPDR